MENNNTMRLSLDELCMAVGLTDEHGAAYGIMVATLGKIDESEFKGRLLAAGDSLVSRGLITALDDEGIHLDESLEKMVLVVGKPSFSLRLDRVKGGHEDVTTYHHSEKGTVEHKREGGLAHFLRAIDGPDEILQFGSDLFELDSAREFKVSDDGVPSRVLERAGEFSRTNADYVEKYLSESGLEESTSAMIANDLREALFRGSVTRVDYHETEIISDKGLLLLKGPERTWIFRICRKEDEAWLKIIPGTESSFRDETEKLLKD